MSFAFAKVFIKSSVNYLQGCLVSIVQVWIPSPVYDPFTSYPSSVYLSMYVWPHSSYRN